MTRTAGRPGWLLGLSALLGISLHLVRPAPAVAQAAGGRGASRARAAIPPIRPADEPPSEARRLYGEARALLRSRQREQAAELLRQAAALAQAEGLPADEQALFHRLLGLALGGAGRDEEAAVALGRSLELDPSDGECRLELGQVLLRLRQYGPAREQGAAALRSGLSDPADQKDAEELVATAGARERLYAGKDLLKGRQFAAAADTLEAAVELAAKAHLSADEQSLAYYLLGLALTRGERETAAIAAYRQALRLTPADADTRLELGQLLLRADKYDEALVEAEEALRLGLSEADDTKAARELVAAAKLERLRERLSAQVSIAYGYDSNVLQGRYETIGGFFRPTSTGTGTTTLRQTFLQEYFTPIAPKSEYDLPLTVNFDVQGRPLGNKIAELWTGLRGYFYIMTVPEFYAPLPASCGDTCPPFHNVYNLIELTLPVRLVLTPITGLRLELRAEGFGNFSGYSDKSGMEPFQGGFLAGFNLTYIESRRFRTRFSYDHQLRRSFHTADSYLNGDRDDIRLSQELRVAIGPTALRVILGDRFRSDLADRYQVNVPYTTDSRTSFNYLAPLTYIGNEVSLRLRHFIPWQLELGAKAAYEYRYYYKAAYGLQSCLTGARGNTTCGDLVAATEVYRRDSLVSAEFYVNKKLPRGFSLEASYNGIFNFSNIENKIDNRNYTKHTINVTADYSF